MADPASEKVLARSTVLRARSERLPEPDERTRRTAALLELTAGAETVAGYVSFGTEPATDDLLAAWLARGTRVLLPVVLPDRDLEFRAYDGGLVTGRLGMASPPSSAPVVPLAEASIVVVPALACDRRGERLRGRGGASYPAPAPGGPEGRTVARVFPQEGRADGAPR